MIWRELFDIDDRMKEEKGDMKIPELIWYWQFRELRDLRSGSSSMAFDLSRQKFIRVSRPSGYRDERKRVNAVPPRLLLSIWTTARRIYMLHIPFMILFFNEKLATLKRYELTPSTYPDKWSLYHTEQIHILFSKRNVIFLESMLKF